MHSPFLHLLSQTSSILWLCRTSCHPFEFLTHFFVLVSIPLLRKWQDLSCSDNILLIHLAKLSDWGMPLYPYHSGYSSIVCCEKEHIDHFQPHNNFPALSLHFRFGSVAPWPTLKSNVTVSIPRTRYRRLVRPYLIGFSYCIVISLPKLAELLPLARGNRLRRFRSSHLFIYYTTLCTN